MKITEEDKDIPPFQNISFSTVVESRDRTFVFFGAPLRCSLTSSASGNYPVYVYEHSCHEWKTVYSELSKNEFLSEIPKGLCLASGCYVERINSVFLFGGLIRSKQSSYDSCGFLANASNNLFEWSFGKGVGSKGPKFEKRRQGHKYSSSGTFRLLPLNGIPPKEVFGSTLDYHKQNHTLICFGGCSGNGLSEIKEIFGDVYEYDLFSMNWKILQTSGRRPRLCLHTSTIVDDKLYVVGGLVGESQDDLIEENDFKKKKKKKRMAGGNHRMTVYILNLKSNRWTEVMPKTPPISRFGHFTFPVLSQSRVCKKEEEEKKNMNLLVMFGMNNKSQKCEKSMCLYNIKEKKWKVMKLQVIENNYDDDNNNNSYKNKKKKKKKKKKKEDMFRYKSLYGSCVVYNSNRREFLLFGGEDYERERKEEEYRQRKMKKMRKMNEKKEKKRRRKSGNNMLNLENGMMLLDEEEDDDDYNFSTTTTTDSRSQHNNNNMIRSFIIYEKNCYRIKFSEKEKNLVVKMTRGSTKLSNNNNNNNNNSNEYLLKNRKKQQQLDRNRRFIYEHERSVAYRGNHGNKRTIHKKRKKKNNKKRTEEKPRWLQCLDDMETSSDSSSSSSEEEEEEGTEEENESSSEEESSCSSSDSSSGSSDSESESDEESSDSSSDSD